MAKIFKTSEIRFKNKHELHNIFSFQRGENYNNEHITSIPLQCSDNELQFNHLFHTKLCKNTK
jgi:hypothetical protein